MTTAGKKKRKKKRGLSGEDNACYSDVTSLPQRQAQFQQCKKTPEAAVGDGVRGSRSSCLPIEQVLAPPATGLSTPLHFQPHSIAELEEGQ